MRRNNLDNRSDIEISNFHAAVRGSAVPFGVVSREWQASHVFSEYTHVGWTGRRLFHVGHIGRCRAGAPTRQRHVTIAAHLIEERR